MDEYGAESVKCPFYISKNKLKDAIRCEGIFCESATQIFENIELKQTHRNKYCNTFNYKNCPYAAGLLEMYELNQKQMPGTFAEDTLLKYRQK